MKLLFHVIVKQEVIDARMAQNEFEFSVKEEICSEYFKDTAEDKPEADIMSTLCDDNTPVDTARRPRKLSELGKSKRVRYVIQPA